MKNTRNSAGGDSRYLGEVFGYIIGVEYKFNPSIVAGISAGYSRTDLTTTYNDGNFGEDTWNLTPYFVYFPNDKVKLSGLVGYSRGSIKQDRNFGFITSDANSHTYFGQFSGAYSFKPIEDLPLALTVSGTLSASNRTVESYVESDGDEAEEQIDRVLVLGTGLEADNVKNLSHFRV